jgi:hypothetical protein
MPRMRIQIDLEITPRGKRVLTGLLLVGLCGTVSSAHAGWMADVSWIKADGAVSAAKLKALFDEAGDRLTALETKPIVIKNGRQWSLGATYCGITAPTNGAAGG